MSGTASTLPAATRPTRCHTTDLAAEIGPYDSEMSQSGLNLVLVNRSTRPCRIYGHGGLALL